jgi:predicted  nucleic acid-binding Zn-ribbon protein
MNILGNVISALVGGIIGFVSNLLWMYFKFLTRIISIEESLNNLQKDINKMENHLSTISKEVETLKIEVAKILVKMEENNNDD